nr:MAG TPA: hypothetical protein [Caudoviricetes sp.]
MAISGTGRMPGFPARISGAAWLTRGGTTPSAFLCSTEQFSTLVLFRAAFRGWNSITIMVLK